MAPRRNNVRLAEACDAYMDRIRNEGQAKASITTAHYALRRFRKAVATRREPNPYLHTITDADMDEYCFGTNGIRRGLNGRGIAAVSFNRYRSVLIRFFDYALLKRWVDVNPMEAVPAARPDGEKTRLLLNASELTALLENCTNPVQRIACSIGMNTGLRANDIRHLTIFDASLASGTIQTEIRKTRKMDVKPITADLHPELVRWLDFYADRMGVPDRGQLPADWLLVPAYDVPAPNARDKRVRPRPLDVHTHPHMLVQRPLKRMGYPTKGEGFHTLRRSSARVLFESLRENGESRDHALMIVQAFLNHADTKQTQAYLGLSHERTIRDTLLKGKPFISRMAAKEQERVTDGQIIQWQAG